MSMLQTTTLTLILDLSNTNDYVKSTCKAAFKEALSLVAHANEFGITYQATAEEVTTEVNRSNDIRSYRMAWTYPISYIAETLEQRMMRKVLKIGGDCFINHCLFDVTLERV
jgi:hypothetical protein